MTYHYSLLRFVPDPARGEFINLGILAGDDDARDWELRLVQNLRRLKAIDDKDALGLALAFAARLEEHIVATDQIPETTSVAPISTEWLASLAGEMQNVVQLTEPTPLVAESAEAALDTLFTEFIVDPAAQRFRFQKKHRAVASTRRAYRDHEVPEDAILEPAPVTAGPYDGRFDFAVSNGSVVQLVQCWSFQLPNQAELAEQVKAWAWVVRELRDRGGAMRYGERDVRVPEGEAVEIAAVFIPPFEGQEDTSAFEEARAAFDETSVRQLTPDEADEVGRSAADRLQLVA
jgi:hypothetical protein